ncbi:hypothetical protein OS493_011258 [Desmophyllum pertusum]|uniref:VWFA domain-containing protein n=1 Tax=Desmophyllum pertusum TaxID=174260 RepID=A0A9X0CU83_9CNID|nr:hypothetical protein OS493_011258 [Desmophyllum pertusum]
MDLALTKAADNLREARRPGSRNQHQLVVLITAGKQLSNQDCEDDKDLLLSASKALSSSDIKIIIVPVGLETNFQQLGLIVKRPQYLFPLSSFDDFTSARTKGIAGYIKKTLDIVSYAQKVIYTFSEVPPSELWEAISLCSDVMEGAWYLLYGDQKKAWKVKEWIRESIDNIHNRLVSDSKICISLAVFGPLGAGKSFFLNFLLNQGLSKKYQVEYGPLPSAYGASQTPLPVNIKFGKKVQVLLHKQEEGVSPVVWFPEEELVNGTLERVNDLLKSKFQDVGSFSDAKCIELQGPFPVFYDLKERAMTTCGHLELEVDVEFVDVPGRGDETGNESIDIELSKADVILFFNSGESGRPVSSEDIAQVFRRREEFEFASRPKFVHVVNDRRKPSEVSSCDFNLLQEQNEEYLNRAWSSYLSSSKQDEPTSGCYTDVRAKLPQLTGEALLDKLTKESKVIYFHLENSGVLNSLKHVINDHVQNVKIKEMIHPFLLDVHLAAKTLRTRIGKSLTIEKKKSKTGKDEVKTVQVPFQMHCKYDENISLSLDSLKVSLGNFRCRLVDTCKNANLSKSDDFDELAEILCKTRVDQFCANSARAYLVHVLEKVQKQKPLGKYKKRWRSAGAEEKKDLFVEILHALIVRSITNRTGTREKQYKKSHFMLVEQLNKDVNELFAVRCSRDATRPLQMLNNRLKEVITFCTKSIREINPHPSLDMQTDIIIPDEMKENRENGTIPSQSRHEKIIKEMTDLLLKPAVKGADVIRKLESMLSLGKGPLAPRQPQSADQQRLWAMAVVKVLSDEEHFNILPEPRLTQGSHDPDVDILLEQARKRLFAHQKSSVTCKIVNEQAIPDKQIHLRKSSQEKNCLEVLVCSKMRDNLISIRTKFEDPSKQIAPIFMPTIRPGPTVGMRGNFFLEEDPWSKDVRIDDTDVEEEGEMVQEGRVEDLNIFLVVEQQHLEIVQSTINGLEVPKGRNMMYVVLPQNGRGIGVTRAIIKSLTECLEFSLYWTIDDDVQFMYQFDGNGRKWHKCSLTGGLLFGQEVWKTCLKKHVKEMTQDERDDLFDDVTRNWPSYAKKTKRSVSKLLVDDISFAKVQKNPGYLHSPFDTNILEDCGGDAAKEEEMKACEQKFIDECEKRIFQEDLNHIAGISIPHESSKRHDYMSKYPSADYMQSEQRFQVVLNNMCALKERNFVSDQIIFHDEEWQIKDINKRNTPYWGIRGSDKSFCRALTVGGVIGYQVIRVVHGHKRLINVFDRVGPSYIGSQSPHRSEDEDEESH